MITKASLKDVPLSLLDNYFSVKKTRSQRLGEQVILTAAFFNTPLGVMLAIADQTALSLLAFIDQRYLDRTIKHLITKRHALLTLGTTPPLDKIEQELAAYFSNTLKHFNTPLTLVGSCFQQCVWTALTTIPTGKTCSYQALALRLNKPLAYRAVANANGANPLALIIPCHRVINSNGQLGGYGGGIVRKQWLLTHEMLA